MQTEIPGFQGKPSYSKVQCDFGSLPKDLVVPHGFLDFFTTRG